MGLQKTSQLTFLQIKAYPLVAISNWRRFYLGSKETMEEKTMPGKPYPYMNKTK